MHAPPLADLYKFQATPNGHSAHVYASESMDDRPADGAGSPGADVRGERSV